MRHAISQEREREKELRWLRNTDWNNSCFPSVWRWRKRFNLIMMNRGKHPPFLKIETLVINRKEIVKKLESAMLYESSSLWWSYELLPEWSSAVNLVYISSCSKFSSLILEEIEHLVISDTESLLVKRLTFQKVTQSWLTDLAELTSCVTASSRFSGKHFVCWNHSRGDVNKSCISWDFMIPWSETPK